MSYDEMMDDEHGPVARVLHRPCYHESELCGLGRREGGGLTVGQHQEHRLRHLSSCARDDGRTEKQS